MFDLCNAILNQHTSTRTLPICNTATHISLFDETMYNTNKMVGNVHQYIYLER